MENAEIVRSYVEAINDGAWNCIAWRIYQEHAEALEATRLSE